MCCKLCLQNKPLRNSHIIPEFLYKNEKLYDDKHRFLRLSSESTEPNILEQKGRRQHLLCWDCEQWLDRQYEKYAKRVLYDERHIYSTQLQHVEVLVNIDYARFKLFLLSILWRVSISTLSEFSHVNVGPHEERIRKMLLDFDPGYPYQFGCLVLDPDTETDPVTGLQVEHSVMLQPQTVEAAGYTTVLLMFGGLIWTYVVSDQLKDFPAKERFLSRDGKLVIARDVGGAARELLQKSVAEARRLEERRNQHREF